MKRRTMNSEETYSRQQVEQQRDGGDGINLETSSWRINTRDG